MHQCNAAAALILWFALVCGATNGLAAGPEQARIGDVVGKITVGYQGWFSCEGDGSPLNKWRHQNLEMWPDVREYAATYLTSEPPLGNGEPAKMFSSYDDQVVQTHFRWMAENEIDCAALQRFGNEILPGSTLKAQRDGMALKVMHAAEKSGVKFYLMYDLSGWGVKGIQADWTQTLVEKLKLLDSPAYAHQDGKPVVSIYGIGYTGWPGTAAEAAELLAFFKKQGCYVIGSVPGQWRMGTGDSQPGFERVYMSFDMLSAWGVGRRMDANYARWIEGDLAMCQKYHVDFQPCLYPGTSFYNTNGTLKNMVPRNHGDFLWAQFLELRSAHIKSAYVAMFDELNEATCIFKCAEDATMIPTGQAWYLGLDADGVHVSSDFYLREVRDGSRMIKDEMPLSTTCPTPRVTSAEHVP